MVKGECFLTAGYRLGLSLLWQNLCARVGWNAGEGLFTWNPKSTEAEDSREERPRQICGICQEEILSHSKVPSQPGAKGVSFVTSAVPEAKAAAWRLPWIQTPFHQFLMHNLPQKSKFLLKHRLLLLSGGKHYLVSNRNKSQHESFISKRC